MKITVLLILFLFANTALAATPPVGIWEWSSTEVSDEVFTTPESLGFTLHREFSVDGTYIEYRNGDITRSGTFGVEDIEFNGYNIDLLLIECDGAQTESCAYFIIESRLALWWGTGPEGYPYYPVEALDLVDIVSDKNYSLGGIKSLFR